MPAHGLKSTVSEKNKTGLPNKLIHQQIMHFTGHHESPVLLRVTLWCPCFSFKEYLLLCQVSSVYQSKENIYFWQTCKCILGCENLAEIALIHITYILPLFLFLFCFCLDTEWFWLWVSLWFSETGRTLTISPVFLLSLEIKLLVSVYLLVFVCIYVIRGKCVSHACVNKLLRENKWSVIVCSGSF